jgi:DNA-binding transcriptional LysR family regulator
MLAELEALVAVAETGSMERAAGVLHVTPSALTRRIQRLEVELGLVLLDRHFKPPKLTQAGFEALEKTRTILSSLGDLKASSCAKAMPVGPFRLGLSHSLARPEISKIIIGLRTQFPLLQPRISTEVSPQLLERLHLGDLDAALVILPLETALPRDLNGVTLSRQEFRLVQARTSARRRSSKPLQLDQRTWILNPPGCLVREEISKRVERLGAPLRVSAEVHNSDLQLSLIAGNMGVGIVEADYLRTHSLRAQLSIMDDPRFNLSARVAYFRGRNLGTRDKVALELERMLVNHFQAVAKSSAGQTERDPGKK